MMIDAYCSYKGWWGFSGFARILNKGSFGGFGVGFCWAGGQKSRQYLWWDKTGASDGRATKQAVIYKRFIAACDAWGTNGLRVGQGKLHFIPVCV